MDDRNPTLLDEFTRGIKALTCISTWLIVTGCTSHTTREPGISIVRMVFPDGTLAQIARFFGH